MLETLKIHSLVRLYLIHSYIYYILDDNVIEDYEYNSLCRALFDRYDELTEEHKSLIDVEDLKANTAYTLLDTDYPPTIHKSALYTLKHRVTLQEVLDVRNK